MPEDPNNPTPLPAGTEDLESRVGAGGPGAYLSSQQPDQGEQPFVQDQGGATLAMGPQTVPPEFNQPVAQAGAIKGLLTNFFGQHGVGGYLMNSFGMPTPEQRQQRDQTRALTQQHVQSQINLQNAQAKNTAESNELVDFNGVPVARKALPGLMSKQMALEQAAKYQEVNSLLSAAGKGFQFTTDPTTGKPTIQPLAQAQLSLPQQAAIQQKQQGKTPNEIELIMRTHRGGPDAAEAATTLKELQQRKIQLAGASGEARGKGFGMWKIFSAYDPETGMTQPHFGIDILNARDQGKTLLSAGALPASVLIGAQRLSSETKPAIKGVADYISAFDNSSDRAIYARLMKENVMSEGGDAHMWMGNILNQALASGLSPEGQKLAVRLSRMNETIGTLRQTLGLPATNSMTALSLRMLPGPATPSSAYARDQMEQLQQVVDQALAIPGLGGKAAGGERATGVTLPPGAPPAPTEDGKVLKFAGKIIGKSKGGKWVAP